MTSTYFLHKKILDIYSKLYKAKHYLNKRSLLVLDYSLIHTYMNYGNIAWGSTNRTNLKKINSLQKHATRIIHCKDRFAHARELFQESKILNVFRHNILNNLVVMHKIKSQTAPKILQGKFRKPTHKYPTHFSTSNYSIQPFKLSKSKYRISIRGHTLWKNISTNSEKKQESVTVFKNSIRKKLLELQQGNIVFLSQIAQKAETLVVAPKGVL